ncbi:hypothetical protein ACWCQR_37325, partial [Streptomyces sp. NPDC002172]
LVSLMSGPWEARPALTSTVVVLFGAAWLWLFELYLSDETPKPDGFQELGLTSLDGGPFTGARLEYVAGTISGEPDIGTWHVYDERFVAQDGRVYAIASYGPDSDGGDDELAYLTTAVDWFCPPDTTCDADPAAD